MLDFAHRLGETEAYVRTAIRRTAIKLTSWLAVVGWMGVIFMLSSVPGSQIPGRWGPLGHFGEYAILGAILVVALELPNHAITAIAIASTYGITDELHQLFVPGRRSDPVDWLVDTIGAAVGAYVATRIYRTLRARAGVRET